ncbi:MAG: hypothetical protein AB1374_11995 [Bacillota bacterium]
MSMSIELIRVLGKIEGKIIEEAKGLISKHKFDAEDTPRTQFKLATTAAREAGDLNSVKAFLAYQASRDKKVWGHSYNNELFIQRAWELLKYLIKNLEKEAKKKQVWSEEDDQERLKLRVAELFFAHLQRAFEIWKDAEARRYYFGDDEQNRGGGVEGAS